MIEDLLAEAASKMDQASIHTVGEFATVRTGRANPAILQRIRVDYYGTPTPIQQLASVSVPEARLLVVQPYDATSIPAIERAVQEADLGLNPSNDGKVIRLAFPALTEERRKELIRVVRQIAEDGRVAIRNIRRSCKEDMELLRGEISDDDIHRGEKTLQAATNKHVVRLDELLERKETELLQV